MKKIYMDHAATTPLDPEIFKEIMPYYTEVFGNANSQHLFGRESVVVVDRARDIVAKCLGAKANEIYFTSGGTESDNWAIRGVARAYAHKGKHLIISAIEHPAMLTTAKELIKEGFEVTFAAVDEYGFVDLEKLKKAIRKDTTFIGIMYANNEIGTIQPIAEISKIAQEHGIVFFTDAVQAAGVLNIDVKNPKVDMLSLSGHKFYGPKGVGVLYIRSGLRIDKILTGGHQERAMRGGTTNVPGVLGLALALEKAIKHLDENNKYVTALRDHFIHRVQTEIPHVILNGHPTNRLPANANFAFRFIEGESLLFSLDMHGIAISSGSACSSGSLEPSHVLLAIGLPEGTAHGSLRFSFGKHNTMEEVDYTVDRLKEIIVRLRDLSPIFPKTEKNVVFDKKAN